jgi:hypothetical protein
MLWKTLRKYGFDKFGWAGTVKNFGYEVNCRMWAA